MLRNDRVLVTKAIFNFRSSETGINLKFQRLSNCSIFRAVFASRNLRIFTDPF